MINNPIKNAFCIPDFLETFLSFLSCQKSQHFLPFEKVLMHFSLSEEDELAENR